MFDRRSLLKRGWPVTVAALVMALATAGGSAGAVGDISHGGCISDNDASSEQDCSPRMDGLNGATAVAVSPNLRSAYVAAGGDNSLVVLNRSRRTGRLTFAECFDDDLSGTEASCPPVPAMTNPTDVVVSPDGRSVYTAVPNDGAVSRFSRKPATGALTYAGCVEGIGVGAGCVQTVPGISEPTALSISGDGRSLYVVSYTDDAVVRFNRNPATGALAFAQCIADDGSCVDECSKTTGLDGVTDVEVSPDGKSVYAVGNLEYTIVRFTRSPATGAITPAQCLEGEGGSEPTCANVPGLESAERVEASADGRSVYTLGTVLTRFDRNRATGMLAFGQCFQSVVLGGYPVCQSLEDFVQLGGLALSPDDRSLYAAALSDDSLHRFNRNPRTGALSFRGCFEDVDNADSSCADVEGLEGLSSLTVTGDGRSLYAVGHDDGAVGIFDRVPLRCRGRAGTIYGTPFKDVLRGTRARDVFITFGGPDRALGLGGRDVACGGGGADRLLGGRGADLLLAAPDRTASSAARGAIDCSGAPAAIGSAAAPVGTASASSECARPRPQAARELSAQGAVDVSVAAVGQAHPAHDLGGQLRAVGGVLGGADDLDHHLVAVELLDRDVRPVPQRDGDRLVEHPLDLARRRLRREAGAQLDPLGLAQGHDRELDHGVVWDEDPVGAADQRRVEEPERADDPLQLAGQEASLQLHPLADPEGASAEQDHACEQVADRLLGG
jgi:6-phosphogluconolactonase (cycloisomerase 2 family)